MTSSIVAPFARNAWYVAAWSNEVAQAPLGRVIMNEPLVLFRDRNGKVGALEDRCCHRGAPLSHGEIVPEGLQCGYHGLIYDATGKCVTIPGQMQIPPSAKVKSYPIVERQEFIWIWMGDPSLADPNAIIDYPYHDDSANWPHSKSVTAVDGNYMLLIDNLMDLTHIGYLHKSTIGGTPRAHVEAKVEVKRTEKGVRFLRWLLNSPAPPTMVKAVGFKGHVDRWSDFEYVAPSSVLQWSGAIDVGRGAEENRFQPGYHVRLFHGMTPVSESSSYYFWSGANGYRQAEPSATRELHDELVQTFKEDKTMIEAQQKRLDMAPDRVLTGIKADQIVTHARRALESMIAVGR